MKKTLGAASLILVAVILGTLVPVNAKATSMPLAYAWFGPALPAPVGKVIFNMPDGHNTLLVTFVLQAAQPSTTYTVGFDIFGACPDPFGISFDGYVSFCQTQYPIGIYALGTVATDELGAGSFHMNLDDLPTGTHNLIFWMVPCSPPWNCGYVPTASTGIWNAGPYATITVP